MKFLSKNKLEHVPLVDETLERYVRFCANPLRPEAEVRKEYELLRQVDGIERIVFAKAVPDILMLATRNIIIYDPHTQTDREVGEFIIFIRRHYANPWWDVGFRFQNVRGELYGSSGYMHPHIYRDDDDTAKGFPVGTGSLCIQRGRYHIYQHIRQGEMHLAADLLMEILYTYNPRGPYHDLYNWPLVGEEATNALA